MSIANWYADANHDVKSKLGFADTQRFSKAMLDAVTQVASTSMSDDCGEGFKGPTEWSKLFASLDRSPYAKPAAERRRVTIVDGWE